MDDDLFYRARSLNITYNDKPKKVVVNNTNCKHVKVVKNNNKFSLKIELIRSYSNLAYELVNFPGQNPGVLPESEFEFGKYWKKILFHQQFQYMQIYKEWLNGTNTNIYKFKDNIEIFPIILIKGIDEDNSKWNIPRFIIFNHITNNISDIATELSNYNYIDTYIFNNDKIYYLKNGETIQECTIEEVEYLPVDDLVNSYTTIYKYNEYDYDTQTYNLTQYIRLNNRWIKLYNINDIISISNFNENKLLNKDLSLIRNDYIINNEMECIITSVYGLSDSTDSPEELQYDITDRYTVHYLSLLSKVVDVYTGNTGNIISVYPTPPDISNRETGYIYGVGDLENYSVYIVLDRLVNYTYEKYSYELTAQDEYTNGNVYLVPNTSGYKEYNRGFYIDKANTVVRFIGNTIIFNSDKYFSYGLTDDNIEELSEDNIYDLNYSIVNTRITDSHLAYWEQPIKTILFNNINVDSSYEILFQLRNEDNTKTIVYKYNGVKIYIPSDVVFTSIYYNENNQAEAYQIPFTMEYAYSFQPNQNIRMLNAPVVSEQVLTDTIPLNFELTNISKTVNLPSDYWDLDGTSYTYEVGYLHTNINPYGTQQEVTIDISNLYVPTIDFQTDYILVLGESNIPYEFCYYGNNPDITDIKRSTKSNKILNSEIVTYNSNDVLVEKVFFGESNAPLVLTSSTDNSFTGGLISNTINNRRLVPKLLMNLNSYGTTYLSYIQVYLETPSGDKYEFRVSDRDADCGDYTYTNYTLGSSTINIDGETYTGIILYLRHKVTRYIIYIEAGIRNTDDSIKYKGLIPSDEYNFGLRVRSGSSQEIPYNKVQFKIVPYLLYETSTNAYTKGLPYSATSTFYFNPDEIAIDDIIDKEVHDNCIMYGVINVLPTDITDVVNVANITTSGTVDIVRYVNGTETTETKWIEFSRDPLTRELTAYIGSDNNSDPDEEYAYYSVYLYLYEYNDRSHLYIKTVYNNDQYNRGDEPIIKVVFNSQISLVIQDRG